MSGVAGMAHRGARQLHFMFSNRSFRDDEVVRL